MASTGGGAARGGKRRDPDIAGQDGAATADSTSMTEDPLVRTESKLDRLVNSIGSLVQALGGKRERVPIARRAGQKTSRRQRREGTSSHS
jgi:hypothetical protein